jgi:hypothetical protein
MRIRQLTEEEQATLLRCVIASQKADLAMEDNPKPNGTLERLRILLRQCALAIIEP